MDGLDLAPLLPFGSGLVLVLATVKAIFWIVPATQKALDRTDAAYDKSLEKLEQAAEAAETRHRSELDDQRKHIATLETRLREQANEIDTLRQERLELLENNLRLDHRISVLEETLARLQSS